MIWFDFDNSPHVPLFRPILRELERRPVPFIVTARDFAQTKELLSLWSIEHTLVGRHGGAGKMGKIVNLFQRAGQLRRVAKPAQPRLAVSHGSRTQVLAARWMGIPALVMLDYEFTESRIFNSLCRFILVPSMIPDARLSAAGFKLNKVLRYHGFKEEIYLADFVPRSGFRQEIGVAEDEILVTVRPPSMTGNYHDARSEGLFTACLKHFSSIAKCHVLISNRTVAEKSLWVAGAGKGRVSVLSRAVDGLQLLWHSDLVVSGGGTMNREAALLGVPTFSIFTGRRPYLDEYLSTQGKLQFIERTDEVSSIQPTKRSISNAYRPSNNRLALQVTDLIIDLSFRH
jgi:predicted glycosyltransferase